MAVTWPALQAGSNTSGQNGGLSETLAHGTAGAPTSRERAMFNADEMPVFTPGDRDGEGAPLRDLRRLADRAETGAPWLADETEDQPHELPP